MELLQDYSQIDNEIQEIRRYKALGYSDQRIMNQLSIPRTTFYRYKARMREQMQEVMKQHDKSMVMEDVELCRTRLEDLLFRVNNRLLQDTPALTVNQLDTLTARAEEIALHIARLQYDAEKFLSSGIDGRDKELHGEPAGEQAKTEATATG